MKMRRLVPKHEESKRRKRNQLTVGLVLIFLMFFSTVGFAVQIIGGGGNEGNIGGENTGEQTQTISYNGFEFREQSGFWILNKDNINFIFRNNPNEVAKVDSIINSLDNYLDKPLYINSESIESESEVQTNLLQFVSEMENACLEGENCGELLIRSCEENFIIIKETIGDEQAGISQENNCVFIKGEKQDLVKLTDEFLFKLLGVES